MASPQPEHRLHIPHFEPLPPTNFLNRLMNKVLAPIAYLLFTIVMAIIVVPVYTMFENLGKTAKSGRNRNGGVRVARDYSDEEGTGSSTNQKNQLTDYLKQYGSSYGKRRS